MKHILPLSLLSILMFSVAQFSSLSANELKQPQNNVTDVIHPKIHSITKSEQIREVISPDKISADQGSSYIARLSIPRSADQKTTSKCILLEDGKPLPHPHARHKLIREQGRGHYSHWTSNTLYFSTSDSSDPRTNGKKYELISTESYNQKQSSFNLTEYQSEIRFPSISQRRPQPIKIVWKNQDSHTRVSPSWKRKGSPDLTSQETMLASILKPGMSSEEKSLAIWKFLVDWRYHHTPAESGDELHDPVKFLNVYGYGFCDDCATNFSVLANRAGLQSRVWGLGGHVVGETFYDGRWHMFDPDHQVFYRNQQGVIAGVEELSQHPELITKTPQDPIGSPSALIAQLYTSTDNNRVYKKRPQIKNTVVAPSLEPLDQVEFRYTNAEFIHQKDSAGVLKAPIVGNGTLKRTVRLVRNLKQTSPEHRQWHLKWPYVFLKGSLNLKLESPVLVPTIYVSHHLKSWEKLDGVINNNHLLVSLDEWIQKQPTAVYECYFRLENPSKIDPADSIQQVNMEVTFQFAPRALAHMEKMNNTFQMKLTSDQALPRANKQEGIKVQLVWNELE